MTSSFLRIFTETFFFFHSANNKFYIDCFCLNCTQDETLGELGIVIAVKGGVEMLGAMLAGCITCCYSPYSFGMPRVRNIFILRRFSTH